MGMAIPRGGRSTTLPDGPKELASQTVPVTTVTTCSAPRRRAIPPVRASRRPVRDHTRMGPSPGPALAGTAELTPALAAIDPWADGEGAEACRTWPDPPQATAHSSISVA